MTPCLTWAFKLKIRCRKNLLIYYTIMTLKISKCRTLAHSLPKRLSNVYGFQLIKLRSVSWKITLKTKSYQKP